jgi:hypothetical protein
MKQSQVGLLKPNSVLACCVAAAMEEGRKLYVWNLPYSVDWAELKRVFSAAGNGKGHMISN